MVLERLAGLHDKNIDKHAIYTNLFAIPAILIYVLALLDKRKNYYQGIMSYGQGVKTGLIITAFVTILAPLTQYLTSAVISPQYFANAVNYSVETGSMTQAAAEKYFSMGNYLLQTIIFTPLMGIITTLIVAIFTRKRSKENVAVRAV